MVGFQLLGNGKSIAPRRLTRYGGRYHCLSIGNRMTDDRKTHWEKVYATKDAREVSWFEGSPSLSLALIDAVKESPRSVIDIGGGAALLAGTLLGRGDDVTVLDLSSAALDVAKARLGEAADKVDWIVADVTAWQPARTYDVWHDRAAFHFLNDPTEQRAYAATLSAALIPGGAAVIGTFAPDAPERCSGLPVTRHDAASISAALGPDFALVGEKRHDHATPGGAIQRFQFSTFRKAK